MIGEIETAIVARIRAASDSGTLGYRIPSVATYQGQLDDPGELAKLLPKFPAVLVTYAGDQEPAPRGRGWEYKPVYTILVVARNLRNEAARRHGAGPDEVGSYQLVIDLRALLVGQRLGLDIAALEPGRVRSIFNGRLKASQMSIYALTFSTAFAGAASQPTGLADFSTFHADWDIPGGATVQPPLPAAEADARDTVYLETSQ